MTKLWGARHETYAAARDARALEWHERYHAIWGPYFDYTQWHPVWRIAAASCIAWNEV